MMTIKAARVNKNMTQQAAARCIGVSPATLRSWEHGKSRPRLDKFVLLCKLYGLEFDVAIKTIGGVKDNV